MTILGEEGKKCNTIRSVRLMGDDKCVERHKDEEGEREREALKYRYRWVV